MELSQQVALCSAMGFFFFGLLTGIWKYSKIHASEDGAAPTYVDICHRASLLYAFACLLLERMVEVSQLSATVELSALVSLVGFFAFAVSLYATHGWLNDTDNQLKAPYTLGKIPLPAIVVHGGMWALIVAEIGGFVVLGYGVVVAM